MGIYKICGFDFQWVLNPTVHHLHFKFPEILLAPSAHVPSHHNPHSSALFIPSVSHEFFVILRRDDTSFFVLFQQTIAHIVSVSTSTCFLNHSTVGFGGVWLTACSLCHLQSKTKWRTVWFHADLWDSWE